MRGFTMVELAIALTIVGLLIGGLLKGQEMLGNARITATIAEVKQIEAATRTFRDIYGELPGDLADGSLRIPNCANCDACKDVHVPNGCGWDNVSPHRGAAEDGAIGWVHWNLQRSLMRGTVFSVSVPSIRSSNETVFFWAELMQAGLIKGITYDGGRLLTNAAAFGETNPSAPIGGGFIVGHADGVTHQPLTTVPSRPGSDLLKGNVLALVPSPVEDLVTSSGDNVLSPAQAAQIDTKLDDGYPLTGSVQAYGHTSASATTGCLNTGSSPYLYNGRVRSKDCGLFFVLNP